MVQRNLQLFFNPKAIAVVGASDHPKKVGGILMKKLSNFKGRVIPISLKHTEVLGKKAYVSIKDYFGRVDLVLIAIPAKGVKKVLEDCGEKGIKNVIVISAGFSEVGERELEKDILKIAKRYEMNLLGPNCFGIENSYLNLDTTFANTSSKKGKIVFISQSGALWSYLSDVSASGGSLGFSGFVSLGNMADLGFADFIKYFNKDEKTEKIVLYVEKLKEGKEFIEVCKNVKKEILVVKAGKTKVGGDATVSHTGSLATDYEIYKGAFKQAGVKLVGSLADALGMKKSVIKFDFKKEKPVVVVTNAGGAGALVTDILVEQGFDVKPPIDVLGTGLAEDYEKVLEKFRDKNYSLVIILTPQMMSEPEKTAEAVVNFKKQTGKEIVAFFFGRNSIKKAKSILEKNKIKCFVDI